MTNQEIIHRLINRDETITQEFFFHKCQPIIFSIISRYYPSGADYDELANDLYLHLMENDARCLRMYEGRSSIYQWLKIVAKNFFLDKLYRDNWIEYESDSRLLDKAKELLTDNSVHEAAMDVAAIIDQIDNERYRLVIQKHVIEGMDFDDLEKLTGIKKANLYNIKMRAMKKIKEIARIARSRSDALCAVRCEEFILHSFGIHKSLEELRLVAAENSWLSEEGALIESLGNTSLLYGLDVEKMYNASLQEIVFSLNEGKKVMAAVDGGELIGDPVEECLEDVLAGGIVDHCVIVLSVSFEDDEVSLFDPAFGPIPLSVSIARFMDAWEDSNSYCILIGKNGKSE